MKTAELHQVIEPGLAAIGPVLDVMTVDEVPVRAAPKAAAVVAHLQAAPDRRRNRSRLAADVQRSDLPAVGHAHQRGIARPAPKYGRFEKKRL